MSSATISPIKKNLFSAYLVNQSEDNNPSDPDGPEEKPTEKPTEQNVSWVHESYTPKRTSFHTVQGKIKRYFA